MQDSEYLKLVEAWRKDHSGTFTTEEQVITWAISEGLIPLCGAEAKKRLADGLHHALSKAP